MAWVTRCLKCWGAIPMLPEDEPIGSMTCTDCPHCGNHRCGALQQQHNYPCTKEPAA